MERIKVDQDFEDAVSEMRNVVEKTCESYRKSKVKEGNYWSNRNLSPDNDSIPNGTKTQYYLQSAEENGNIEKIQEFQEPLAYTLYCDRYGYGPFRFRTWYLDRISPLSKKGTVEKKPELS